MNFRIGHGYDVHKLVEGRDLILGGVLIPNKKGLLGHSDADVLVHAIIDALLGAAALGDIGKIFPDNDQDFKNISSLSLLEDTLYMLQAKGYELANLDATIICQAPKLAAFIPKMIDNVAETLNSKNSKISIKATTEEGLGFTGRGKGIAAHAVCIIEKMNQIGANE